MRSFIAAAACSVGVAFALVTPASGALRPDVVKRATLPTVTVRGNAFFAGNERFYIRGIDYQPGGSSEADDPIADADSCKRDIEKFVKLGINTVRVYTVDNSPDADHDECMNALADAGIYLALDVNTPLYSLNRDDPQGSYNDVYLQSVFATIDKFAGYSNTLLFFSGNEVINAPNNTNCAPFVKATTRDMKSYMAAQDLRMIPVGYSAADVEENRYETALYMNCGSDDQRSDFFAFNDYSWCSPSSFEQSGWVDKVEQYSDYSIPLFLSEYGCITNRRDFSEVESLYGPEMTPVYSGGLVYEYSEEGNGYGLVRIGGDDNDKRKMKRQNDTDDDDDHDNNEGNDDDKDKKKKNRHRKCDKDDKADNRDNEDGDDNDNDNDNDNDKRKMKRQNSDDDDDNNDDDNNDDKDVDGKKNNKNKCKCDKDDDDNKNKKDKNADNDNDDDNDNDAARRLRIRQNGGDDSVRELRDFTALQTALANTPAPIGNGGFKSDLDKSECPASSNSWEIGKFTGSNLPAIPDGAVKYLNNGAGDGPGLDGDGSQWASDGASDSIASSGSGRVNTIREADDNAAISLRYSASAVAVSSLVFLGLLL